MSDTPIGWMNAAETPVPWINISGIHSRLLVSRDHGVIMKECDIKCLAFLIIIILCGWLPLGHRNLCSGVEYAAVV